MWALNLYRQRLYAGHDPQDDKMMGMLATIVSADAAQDRKRRGEQRDTGAGVAEERPNAKRPRAAPTGQNRERQSTAAVSAPVPKEQPKAPPIGMAAEPGAHLGAKASVAVPAPNASALVAASGGAAQLGAPAAGAQAAPPATKRPLPQRSARAAAPRGAAAAAALAAPVAPERAAPTQAATEPSADEGRAGKRRRPAPDTAPPKNAEPAERRQAAEQRPPKRRRAVNNVKGAGVAERPSAKRPRACPAGLKRKRAALQQLLALKRKRAALVLRRAPPPHDCGCQRRAWLRSAVRLLSPPVLRHCCGCKLGAGRDRGPPLATQRPLRVGHDFAGKDAPSHALHNMGVKFELAFASEKDEHARKTIMANSFGCPAAQPARIRDTFGCPAAQTEGSKRKVPNGRFQMEGSRWKVLKGRF